MAISYILTFAMVTIDVAMMGLLKLEKIRLLHGVWILPLAMALYSLQPVFFRYKLEYEGVGVLNVVWNTLSSILIALMGIYVFNEKISTTNAMGMILSILGIILLKV
jgi:multidrug transporter EmrE-like cation transporter